MSFQSVRVYLCAFVFAAVALGAVYALSYACFAEEEAGMLNTATSSSVAEPDTDAGQDESATLPESGEASSEEETSSSSSLPESSDSGSSSTDEEPSSSSEEESSKPDYDFGEEIPPEVEIPPPDFDIDPGMTVDAEALAEAEAVRKCREDIHFMRVCLEFTLFGLFPIAFAAAIIFLVLRWFYRTFS